VMSELSQTISTSVRTRHTIRRGLGSAASAQSRVTRDREAEVLTTKINSRLVALEKDGADVIEDLGKLQTLIGAMLGDARKAVGEMSTMEVTRKDYQEVSQHLMEVEDEIAMLSASIAQWQNCSVDNGDVSSTWSPQPVSSTGDKMEKGSDHGLMVDNLSIQEEEKSAKTFMKSESLVEKPATGGRDGNGSVVMFYNLNPSFMNCDRLFNLIAPYAKVQSIKFLKQNDFRTAMVGLYRHDGAKRVLNFLNNTTIFGKVIRCAPSSKHMVTEFKPEQSPSMANEAKSFKDFSQEKCTLLHHPNNIKHPPTRTIYFYQTPKMTDKEFFGIFEKMKAPCPYMVTWFQIKNQTGMGILQFKTRREALDAICITNLAMTSTPGQRVHLAFTYEREDWQFRCENKSN